MQLFVNKKLYIYNGKQKNVIKKNTNTAIQFSNIVTHLKYIIFTWKTKIILAKANTRAGARVHLQFHFITSVIPFVDIPFSSIPLIQSILKQQTVISYQIKRDKHFIGTSTSSLLFFSNVKKTCSNFRNHIVRVCTKLLLETTTEILIRFTRFVQILKWLNELFPSRFLATQWLEASGVVSLYLGGFSSDKSSLMGPYTLGLVEGGCTKKDATEVRGSLPPFAKTLCSTLTNLSFVISCKNKKNTMKTLFSY